MEPTNEATSPEVSTTTETMETTQAPVEANETSATTAEVSTEEKVSETVSFLDSLDEELRGQKALKDFKDLNGLAKSYLHLNSMIGKKVTDLSPEELGSVYNKLGRPEEKDGYKLPESIPEDVTGWYKEKAFELGLNQDQAKGLMESYMALEAVKQEEIKAQKEAQQEEWIASIKEEFGSSMDKRIETAKKAVEAFGGEDLRAAMDSTGLGNHPAMVKAFAKIGKEMLEGGLTQAEAEATFGMTPEEAGQRLSNLKRDPEFMKAYMSPTHPSHKAAVEELQSYHSIMNSGTTTIKPL